MTLREILNIRIDKGATYTRSFKTYEDETYKIIGMHAIDIFEIEGEGKLSQKLSINDILYGNSNFREVMFYGKNAIMFHEGIPLEGSKHKLYQMQSTLHKDKVKYLNSILNINA